MEPAVIKIILFIVVLVVLSAVAIWLGLGPVVHSLGSMNISLDQL
jgi:hypothetical protein